MTPKEFVTKFLPYATASATRFGFADPYFLLSQQYAENSGNSPLLDKTNNVGSIISRPGKEGTPLGKKKLATNQFWTGEDYLAKSSGLYFRVYGTLQDGYNDFARLLANVYKLNTANTIEDFARAISESKYISEDNGDSRLLYQKNIVSTYYKIKQKP